MNIFVNRDSPVPLHDQIVAQVGQLVASGTLTPGTRLPSIRSLSARLGIHHLTVLAAYRSLAERGVLVIKEGSGVSVAHFAPPVGGWREGVALSAMASYFVAQARARGHSDAAILEACQTAVSPRRISQLLVVNPHPDLQELYLHELASWIDCKMAGITPEELAKEGVRADTCYLTSTNFAAELRRLGGPDGALVVWRLAPMDDLLARAKALPADALVAVVSRSPRFVFLLKEILASVLPDERLIGLEENNADRLRSALRVTSLVVTDATGGERLPGLTRAPVHVHRLLATDCPELLVPYLEPTLFRVSAKS
jgi:DNA-binding transcriptional regulator YhcF (GntR family)